MLSAPRAWAGIVEVVKLAIVLALILSTSISSADPSRFETIDISGPSRGFRPPTRIDVIGPPSRGEGTITQPRPDRPVPPAPVETGSVGILGTMLGVVGLLYIGAQYWKQRPERSGWRSARTSKHSNGYAALLPGIRNIREVAIVPSASVESVHGALLLRW